MLHTSPAQASSVLPQAPAESIQYALTRCQFGHILLGASSRGVVAIALADDRETLIADLKARFPAATEARGHEPAVEWARMLQEYLDSGSTAPALPLDLRGTPFQMRVWLTLMSIKIADKTTYGQLAQRLGAPRAARAVARACATNPIAVVVPCHRVVAQSGALSGYRWGVERKRALLQFEHRSLAALNLAQQRVHAL